MVMTRYDTLILGHHVPTDIQVFLNLIGPPSIGLRSQSMKTPVARRPGSVSRVAITGMMLTQRCSGKSGG
jgi:hypothetical protein